MDRFADDLEAALLVDFDNATVKKGFALADRGGVRDIGIGDGLLYARIMDPAPQPYRVTITIDPTSGLPDPLGAECSCPARALCRHIAATLVVYASRGDLRVLTSPPRRPEPPEQPSRPPSPATRDFERRQVLAELTRALDKSRGAREKTVSLNRPAMTLASPEVAMLVGAVVPRSRRDERWRLVFALGLLRAPAPGAGAAQQPLSDRPMLFPAIQFITKAGKLGRLERYRPERVTEPVDPSAAALLEQVLGNGRCAPLVLHWSYFVEHPEVELFGCDGEGRPEFPGPWEIRRIREVLVSLEPALRQAEAEAMVVIRPVVTLALDGGGDEAVRLGSRWVETWGGRILVGTENRILAWTEGKERSLSFIQSLIALRSSLSLADIHALRSWFDREHPAGLRFDSSLREVRVVAGPPETRLVVALDRYTREIGVAVHFDYGPQGLDSDGGFTLRGRSRDVEDRTVSALEAFFDQQVPTTPAWISPVDGAAAGLRLRTDMEGFLRMFGEELLSRGVALCIESPQARVERPRGPVRILVESGIDWFGIRADGGVPIDLKGINASDELFAAGLVRAQGKLLYIGKEEVEKLKALVALLDPDAKEARVSTRDMDALLRLAELAENRPPDLDRLLAVARTLASSAVLPAVPPPRGLTATLRDYQAVGYSWMSFLADHGLNGCLADDMGLGKTVQALALLARRKEEGAELPSLVVAPVSTLRNWQNEAARFAPALRVLVHHGASRGRDASSIASADLIVVSYATMRMDAELFAGSQLDVLILDEAQNVKNPRSQSFGAVKRLKARHRFTLTGTPLENSVVDLWSQLDFLEPGLLGSLARFRKGFGKANGPRVERLRRVIKPFILRRTKEVVESSLPPKEETTLFAEMGARQTAAYEAIRTRYRLLVAGALKEKGIARSGTVIFEGLLRLRQAACFPAHADPAYDGVPSCKLEVLNDLLDEILAGGHRVLVFSQFVQSLAEIRAALEARKTAYAYLDGSTRDRQSAIDGFQAEGGPPVFLLSLKAGGVGINLTAAGYIVLFDPWWNPAVESQAVDRAHRIGQDKSVFVYRIVTRESIEEQVLELQERKRALAEELIEQNPQSLLSMSEGEILGLFGEE